MRLEAKVEDMSGHSGMLDAGVASLEEQLDVMMAKHKEELKEAMEKTSIAEVASSMLASPVLCP